MLDDRFINNILRKIALITLLIWLSGCSGEKPLTLGYVGSPQGFKGAELAAEMANKIGGIDGREVRIISLDSTRGLSLTDEAVSFFAAEDALAVIDNSAATNDTINTRGVPFIVKPGSAPGHSSDISDKVISVRSPFDTTGPNMADYLWGTGIVSVSVIISANDNPYNDRWLNAFRTRYEENRGVVLKIENIPVSENTSIDKIVSKTVLKETAGLVIIADYKKALEICRLAKSSRANLPIALADPASTWQINDEAEPALQNTIHTRYLNNTNDEVAYMTFESAFREYFDENPTFSAAAVYDVANMLLVAIKGKKWFKSLENTFAEIPSHQGSLGLIENVDGLFVRKTSLARKSETGYVPLKPIKERKTTTVHQSVKGT